jgi:hypothetical protein
MTPEFNRKLAEVEAAVRRCGAAEWALRKAAEDEGKPIARNCAWMEMNESEYQFKSLWRNVRDVLAEYKRQRAAILAMIAPVEEAARISAEAQDDPYNDSDGRAAARMGLREAEKFFGRRWREIRDLMGEEP